MSVVNNRKNLVLDTLTVINTAYMDTIEERTTDSGVTIENVNFKDSGITIPSGNSLTIGDGNDDLIIQQGSSQSFNFMDSTSTLYCQISRSNAYTPGNSGSADDLLLSASGALFFNSDLNGNGTGQSKICIFARDSVEKASITDDGVFNPHSAAGYPSTGIQAGSIFFNTTLGKLQVYDGATWETITSVPI